MEIIQFSTDPAVGGAGVATATGRSPVVHGYIAAVHIAYLGSPPGTTDVTLQDQFGPAIETIVNLANANSDVKLYPRRFLQDNTGVDITWDGTNEIYGKYAVRGQLQATIAQANAGDYVIVTVWVEGGSG